MKEILGIVNVHKKMSIKKGKKYFYYRLTISHSVLERLDLSHNEHVTFIKKRKGVQLVKVTDASVTKTHGFMGLQKIGTRGRICLPKEVAAFFNIADGDYLRFVDLGENDIRLRRI